MSSALLSSSTTSPHSADRGFASASHRRLSGCNAASGRAIRPLSARAATAARCSGRNRAGWRRRSRTSDSWLEAASDVVLLQHVFLRSGGRGRGTARVLFLLLQDRKSVVMGKGVPVRVDIGGGSNIKK